MFILFGIKKYLNIILAFAGAIGVVVLLYTSYEAGVDTERARMQEQIQQQKDAYDEQRSALNNRIQFLAKELIARTEEIDRKQNEVREKVYVYSKTNNDSTAPCIDDEWLRIYNDSLPE